MTNSFEKLTKILKKKDILQANFITELSQDYLNFLEVDYPNPKQIAVMENLVYRRYLYDTYDLKHPLSTIELKCLYLASEGYGIHSTSELLKISPRSVEQHRSAIIQKLHCKNITHAIRSAFEKGIFR